MKTKKNHKVCTSRLGNVVGLGFNEMLTLCVHILNSTSYNDIADKRGGRVRFKEFVSIRIPGSGRVFVKTGPVFHFV